MYYVEVDQRVQPAKLEILLGTVQSSVFKHVLISCQLLKLNKEKVQHSNLLLPVYLFNCTWLSGHIYCYNLTHTNNL